VVATPSAKVTGSLERGTAGTFGNDGVGSVGDGGAFTPRVASGLGSVGLVLRGPVASP